MKWMIWFPSLVLSLPLFSSPCLATLDDSPRRAHMKEIVVDYDRVLQEILTRYQIGESRMNFQGTIVNLIFPVSDLVPDGSISITTYSDTDCTVDITGNDFLVSNVTYDDNPAPDGSKNRDVNLLYTIEPTGIQQSDVWTQDENSQFFMNFCIGINLHTGDASTTNAMTSLETVVLLQVDLLGDFGSEFLVGPNDANEEQAEQIYYVEGFLCDESNEEIIYLEPRFQGSILRVCVKPTDTALADGVYMRRVDSFTFQRDHPIDGTKISQVAVRDGGTANKELTQLHCPRGVELCYFDTLLKSDFYFGAGSIDGFGEAWLQYGRGETRRLKITTRNLQRNLQEEVQGGFAGAAVFNLNFFVLPGDGEFSYGAVAFECDQKNRRVENLSPKKFGETIRVCVTPDEASQMFGIKINRIESWNFTRADDSSVVQPAVEIDGIQAENGLTLLVCPPRSELCIFRTQFVPGFFEKSNGIVNGLGSVVLEYGGKEGLSIARRLEIGPLTRSTRQLQSLEFSNVVGKVPVSLETTVAFEKNMLPERCRYQHKVSEWWKEVEDRDKYMYIGIFGGSLLGILSSLLFCWLCPCLGRRDDEEGNNQDIKVNVDVSSDKKEEHISTVKNIKEESQNICTRRGSDCSTEEEASDASKKDRKRSSRLLLPDGKDDQPDKSDVCFDDPDHPGTRKLRKAVRNFVKENPKEDYGSDVFRTIKKDMDGANYYITAGKNKFAEPSKRETIELIGDLFYEAKKGKGSSSRDVKQPSSRRILDDPERGSSSRDVKQSSSRLRILDDPERGSSLRDVKRSSSRRSLDDDLERGSSSRKPKRRSLDDSRGESKSKKKVTRDVTKTKKTSRSSSRHI